MIEEYLARDDLFKSWVLRRIMECLIGTRNPSYTMKGYPYGHGIPWIKRITLRRAFIQNKFMIYLLRKRWSLNSRQDQDLSFAQKINLDLASNFKDHPLKSWEFHAHQDRALWKKARRRSILWNRENPRPSLYHKELSLYHMVQGILLIPWRAILIPWRAILKP